jgi:hypothetical protein
MAVIILELGSKRQRACKSLSMKPISTGSASATCHRSTPPRALPGCMLQVRQSPDAPLLKGEWRNTCAQKKFSAAPLLHLRYPMSFGNKTWHYIACCSCYCMTVTTGRDAGLPVRGEICWFWDDVDDIRRWFSISVATNIEFPFTRRASIGGDVLALSSAGWRRE